MKKSQHTFRGVEIGQAMLTVTATDVAIPLGTSSATDLAPLLKFDAMKISDDDEEIVKEIQVEVNASSSSSAEEEKSGEEEGSTASATAPPPVCTVTLRLAFVPSSKDRREELYEVLNKTSQRKAAAVEKLRKAAVSASSTANALGQVERFQQRQ